MVCCHRNSFKSAATDSLPLGSQNAELVTLTYGSIVAQLCKDMEGDYLEVNKQLEKMGYNIGLRLIEDFLAKTNMGKCANFRETAESISKVCSYRRVSIGCSPFSIQYFDKTTLSTL